MAAVPVVKIKERQMLRAGFLALALRIQESVADISNRDVCNRLSDALRDTGRAAGKWCYYIDHFGDAESGDVIYSCDGDTMRAPYSISEVNGKIACQVDDSAAIDVVPRTIYEEEVSDEDHYTAMESAKLYVAGQLPVYERFISKTERSAAPSGSFAGKGKSFPILKPSDVMAAVRSIGRAGSENYDAGTLKRNIIRIATAKGWAKELPKAWQSDTASESDTSPAAGSLKLVESSAFAQDIQLAEAMTPGRKIKLIAPGKGSTAFYTEEMLKRDGPNVFKAGTPMRIDHPTEAEEVARPEGSVKDWGAVLSQDAYWLDNGVAPAGAGLYSEVKPFSDHALTIAEKGPYAGVSICAYGEPLKENGKVVMREGVPVLARLTRADGVDMVTRAGAGGMFLSESARPVDSIPLNEGGANDMDAAEQKKLQESVAAALASNVRLMERAIKGDARDIATRVLKGTSLIEAAKDRVIESVTRDIATIPQKDGNVDEAAFTTLVNEAAKTEGAYVASLVGSGRIFGMGAAPAAPVDAKEAERIATDQKKVRERQIRAYRDLCMDQKQAEAAAARGDVEEAA